MNIHIEELTEKHHTWVKDVLNIHWGSTTVVSRGRLHKADSLPGFVALLKGEPQGLLTYHIIDHECEIVTINSLQESCGIGSTLLSAVITKATSAGCKRLWLITTNDNTVALRFYQKRGFNLTAVYRNAVDESRKLKPEIPLTGIDGIPIRDEIELEMKL